MDTETHSYTQKISVAKIYNILSLLEFDILIYLKEGDIV